MTEPEQWHPITTAPAGRPIQIGWWDNYSHELSWQQHVAVAFRVLPLIGWVRVCTRKATHWRELPDPPMGQARKHLPDPSLGKPR
jgi:hypothetical protein